MEGNGSWWLSIYNVLGCLIHFVAGYGIGVFIRRILR